MKAKLLVALALLIVASLTTRYLIILSKEKQAKTAFQIIMDQTFGPDHWRAQNIEVDRKKHCLRAFPVDINLNKPIFLNEQTQKPFLNVRHISIEELTVSLNQFTSALPENPFQETNKHIFTDNIVFTDLFAKIEGYSPVAIKIARGQINEPIFINNPLFKKALTFSSLNLSRISLSIIDMDNSDTNSVDKDNKPDEKNKFLDPSVIVKNRINIYISRILLNNSIIKVPYISKTLFENFSLPKILIQDLKFLKTKYKDHFSSQISQIRIQNFLFNNQDDNTANLLEFSQASMELSRENQTILNFNFEQLSIVKPSLYRLFRLINILSSNKTLSEKSKTKPQKPTSPEEYFNKFITFESFSLTDFNLNSQEKELLSLKNASLSGPFDFSSSPVKMDGEINDLYLFLPEKNAYSQTVNYLKELDLFGTKINLSLKTEYDLKTQILTIKAPLLVLDNLGIFSLDLDLSTPLALFSELMKKTYSTTNNSLIFENLEQTSLLRLSFLFNNINLANNAIKFLSVKNKKTETEITSQLSFWLETYLLMNLSHRLENAKEVFDNLDLFIKNPTTFGLNLNPSQALSLSSNTTLSILEILDAANISFSANDLPPVSLTFETQPGAFESGTDFKGFFLEELDE